MWLRRVHYAPPSMAEAPADTGARIAEVREQLTLLGNYL